MQEQFHERRNACGAAGMGRDDESSVARLCAKIAGMDLAERL